MSAAPKNLCVLCVSSAPSALKTQPRTVYSSREVREVREVLNCLRRVPGEWSIGDRELFHLNFHFCHLCSLGVFVIDTPHPLRLRLSAFSALKTKAHLCGGCASRDHGSRRGEGPSATAIGAARRRPGEQVPRPPTAPCPSPWRGFPRLAGLGSPPFGGTGNFRKSPTKASSLRFLP